MSRRLGVTMFVFVLLGAACSLHTKATAPSLEDVETSLAQGKPRTTLEKYFSCDKLQGTAYEGIESGSLQWVSLAERMLKHSDACYTEGIQASLGRAMQRAPQHVLPLVDKAPELAAEYICLPFISDEIPASEQLAEVVKSRKSIQAVSNNRFEIQRARCLNLIKPIEIGLQTQTGSVPSQ